MKISVVIPVYNVEEYLEKCLNSVINQTYKNIEIIIVDDGSTDASGKICDEYAKKEHRITVIHKENGGLVSARKVGVEKASGDYVSYVDSDDWIEEDMYEKLLAEMGLRYPDVVAFSYIKEYSNYSEKKEEYLVPRLYYKEDMEYIVKEFLEKNKYFYTPIIGQTIWSKLIKTSIIKSRQREVDNRIKIGEDCVSYACILDANSILISRQCLYHYNVRSHSIMHEDVEDKYEDYKLLIKYVRSIVGDKEFLMPLLVQLAYYFLLIMAPHMLKDGLLNLFPDIKEKSRIVLYGKGVIAKSLHNVIKNSSKQEIIAWIDSEDIDKILSDSHIEYDCIIIAIGLSNIVKIVEQRLLNEGILHNKIKRIGTALLLEKNLPKEIREILEKDKL